MEILRVFGGFEIVVMFGFCVGVIGLMKGGVYGV